MNFGGKSKIKPVAPVIRTARVAAPEKKPPRPSALAQHSKSRENVPTASSARGSPASASARSSPVMSTSRATDSTRLQAPTGRQNRRSPARQQDRVDFGDDDDDDDEGDYTTDMEGSSRKRQKLDESIDFKRQLRQKQAFSDEDGGVFEMIHAEDISFEDKKKESEPLTEHVTVKLQYPSSSQQER